MKKKFNGFKITAIIILILTILAILFFLFGLPYIYPDIHNSDFAALYEEPAKLILCGVAFVALIILTIIIMSPSSEPSPPPSTPTAPTLRMSKSYSKPPSNPVAPTTPVKSSTAPAPTKPPAAPPPKPAPLPPNTCPNCETTFEPGQKLCIICGYPVGSDEKESGTVPKPKSKGKAFRNCGDI